jgi:CPA2 family monovalent cation:H+ antiporter-2
MDLVTRVAAIATLGAVLVLVMLRVRQSAVVAYLALGILSGPSGFGLLSTGEAAEDLAGIGLVLLLFFIGLEFDLGSFRTLARFGVPATLLQVGLSTAALGGVCLLLGHAPGPSLLVGLVMALSSTAIVMKAFEDLQETGSATAQASLAVLLGQDFIALLAVAVIPFFATGDAVRDAGRPGPLVMALIAAAGVPLLFFLARRVLPALFKRVAATRNEEVFTLASLAVCLVVASLTDHLGAGLQFGAFLGGLVFSGTRYQHQIRADLTAIKTLALGFCFASIGMLLDLRFVADHAGFVAASVGVVVAIKLVLGTLAFRLLRLPWTLAAATGLALSQVAEFSCILAQAAYAAGLLRSDHFQLVVAVAILTMLFGPAMVSHSRRFGEWVAGIFETGGSKARDAGEPAIPSPAPMPRAVVVGYGPVGRTLCKILIRFGVQTCVVDLDLTTVQRLVAMGREAVFGDATRREVLVAGGLATSRYLVITAPDFATRARIIASARSVNPEICVISRARYLAERAGLEEAGANHIAYEEAEVAAELARLLLAQLDVRPELLDEEISRLRREIAVRSGFTVVMKRPTDAPPGKTQIWIREQDRNQG